ncbi:MAG: DUF4892 domain-containing protein [Gammaproteobacteria bacterium]|jgi:outer membrane protein OmpA-like peptidoglycan-associated protein|nr:DUF4892 domain-containing protein [Gammaproteobacteria bacterium]
MPTKTAEGFLNFRLIWACVLAIGFWAGGAFGAAEQPRDHPLITSFPGSEIAEYDVVEATNHVFVLGNLQRTRGEVVPAAAEKLRGRVTQIVYALPEDFEGGEVKEYFDAQLKERGYEVLFDCEGRACGSSNYWANDIFKRRILYGPERNQYYIAARAKTALEEDPYLSLYLITRANRRLYAYLEVVETVVASDPQILINEGLLAQALLTEGSVILPPVAFTPDGEVESPEAIAYLVRLLQQNPSLSVFIVSHTALGADGLNAARERSLTRAKSVRATLVEQGIDGVRVVAEGIGPLAPACPLSDCAERLELVIASRGG